FSTFRSDYVQFATVGQGFAHRLANQGIQPGQPFAQAMLTFADTFQADGNQLRAQDQVMQSAVAPSPAYQALRDDCLKRNSTFENDLIGSCSDCYTVTGSLVGVCPVPMNLVAFVRELAAITTSTCGTGGPFPLTYLTFPDTM